MKLTVIFILVCTIQLNAKVNGQKLIISEGEMTISKLFKVIQKQTGYTFLYDNLEVNTEKKVILKSSNMLLKEVLNSCFQDEGITYKIFEKTIVLKKSSLPKPTSEVKTFTNFIVKGKVLNEKGIPLYGASITIKGTNIGTATDEKGNFSISAKPGDLLEIEMVGYQSMEITVAENANFNIILKEQTGILDQIVVVGYGTQKRKDITGSVSVVTEKALADRPSVEFGYALEGKAAGVQVIRSSGQPQAGFSIRIRGTSSITSGSEPLYIVDGVPTSSISEINPSDIESFSILKDAASASIYGSSGANGVVLITTKHGKNQKNEVSFETYTGFSTLRKTPDVLNASQYKDLMNEMGQALDMTKYTQNTDWSKELFRTAKSQKYQLSMRGGNESTQFYMSGSYVKQDGVVISNTVNRANFTLNLDHRIDKIFKVGTNISYNRWYDVDVTENSRNGTIMNAILGAPVIGIWNPDGKSYTTDPFRNDLDNPVGLAQGYTHNWTNYRFLGNGYLEATVLPYLKLKSMFGYEKYNGIYNYFVDPFKTVTGRGFKGQAELTENDNQYWISENTLNFNKQFQKHAINFLAGYIVSKTASSASDIMTHNFANPSITTVNGGSVVDRATGTAAATSTVSVVSRLEYGYDDKYLLTANLRSDASSVFGPKNRWGYFPSFSAGWRISKEDFFQNISIISDLKVRGSWGEVGNSQIPAYSYLGTVAPSGTYIIGDQVVAGYLPVTLGNPALKWESTKQTDIGIDLGLLKNRIVFTADYYNKKTSGLLLNSPVPASSGYTTALKNVGDLQNKGFDFELNTINTTGKFKWNSNLNLSLNRNKILNIDGGTLFDGPIDGRANSSIVKAGLPLGSFYGYVAKGVDPTTGNMIYKIADTTMGLQESDRTVIGNANPKYTFGLTNEFSYGSWSLSIFIQGVQGNDILNATRIYSEGMWEPRNQSVAVLKRWTTPGQITNIPRQDLTNETSDFTNYNSQISSRFVENGSYVRLKSLTLGYDLSQELLKKWKIKKLRIYLTAENLLTLTKYSGLDPEVSAFSASYAGTQSNNAAPGIDFGTYPQTRDVIVGLNLTF